MQQPCLKRFFCLREMTPLEDTSVETDFADARLRKSGYDAKFVHQLLKRHECPICLIAMRNPVQTACGHLFCRECLEPVLKRKRPICPLDKEEISASSIFPDNACRREILSLEVYCNYMSGGCTWTGALKMLDDHLETCKYREVQCNQCGQYIRFLILTRHKESDCPMRPHRCEHCNENVPFEQMQAHLDKVCTELLHSCPNNCDPELQMKLAELEHHLATRDGECPLSEVDCPFKDFGCNFVSLRKNIESHLDQYKVYHIYLQGDCFSQMTQQQVKNTAAIQHVMERVASVETRMNAAQRLQDTIDQRVDLLSDQRERHGDRYGGRVEKLEDQALRLTSTVTELQNKVSLIPELPVVRSGITSGYATDSHVGLHSLGAPNATPQRIESLQARVLALDRNVDRCLTSSVDLELRLQLVERAYFRNGILLWKITDFEHRRREAVEGITLSLYSTPFYTSRFGYKMCARVYLNADGLGKNTHLSFFFVIMRGPYDGLLQWPLRQKVTLTLLNQSGKKHITDSFRPDPHSSSFQRPGAKEMNIASGCPMFIRIEHLLNGGFIKEDSIYLRVVVDTTDLPRVPP